MTPRYATFLLILSLALQACGALGRDAVVPTATQGARARTTPVQNLTPAPTVSPTTMARAIPTSNPTAVPTTTLPAAASFYRGNFAPPSRAPARRSVRFVPFRRRPRGPSR